MEFDPKNALGAAPPGDIAAYLEEIGDGEAAARFHDLGRQGQGFSVPYLTNDQWANSGAVFGFIPQLEGKRVRIVDAIGMSPDDALIGKSLKISLDRFYVENYPGLGQHEVLCEFTGKNQAGTEAEAMKFALTLKADDQTAAAISSMPIFVGVNVDSDGVSFEGRSINVRSGDDEMLLKGLSNANFKDGLSLLTTAQPVLKPFVKLAEGVVGAVLSRSKNKEVHSFALGLDFSNTRTSAKLRLGSYVIVQTNELSWDWSVFKWDTGSGIIVTNDGERLPLNYMVFGVSLANE